MDEDLARVDTTGEVTSSRTASTDVRCQNCGREKAEHVTIFSNKTPGLGLAAHPRDERVILICPSRVYEPERHP